MEKARGAATWGIHWPWLKYQQCHCDAGYEGDDCSLRRCPRGDDPETECQTDRSQPLFRVANTNPAKGDLTCTVARLAATPAGSTYRESATCSNRGICDQSTGRCNCFDGFFGLACDHVNT